MNTDLEIGIERVQAGGPVVIFHLRGWLDGRNEEHFLSTARDAYENGARYALLDLAGIDTITSAGMRAVQKVYKMYTPEWQNNENPHLKLAGASPQVNHLLGITGFLQKIPMYETVQAALDSFELQG